MDWKRIEHPDQMELPMEPVKKLSKSAEKVKRYRDRQAKLGRYARSLYVTEDEYYYLQRVLKDMRERGLVPAFGRNAKGQVQEFDV